MAKVKFSLEEAVNRCFDFSYFESAIIAKYYPGKSRILIITGDNSEGKSFFGKLFSLVVNLDAKESEKIEVMRTSMQLRTGPGMEKAFIFGDESWQATGAISANTVRTGFITCRGRKNDHILFLDEPDIGLAESYQGALGKLIAEFAKDMPKRTKALCVVTHSRRIVRHLAPLDPHFLRMGDNKTLPEFLIEPPDREIEDLERLGETSINRFRAIQKCITDGEEARRVEKEKKRPKPKSKVSHKIEPEPIIYDDGFSGQEYSGEFRMRGMPLDWWDDYEQEDEDEGQG